MKHIFLTAFLLCISSLSAQYQFDSIYNEPSGYFYDFDCAGKTCYFGGYDALGNGLLLKTSDGGDSFYMGHDGSLDGISSFFQVACYDSTHCTLGGDLYTTHNGKTFTACVGGSALDGLQWANDSVVFAAGNVSNYFISKDKGVTFTQITAPMSTSYQIQTVSDSVWFVMALNGFFRTLNQGNTWELIPSMPINRFHFLDSLIGFSSTTTKCLIKTIDGGRSWDTINYIGRDTTSFAQTNQKYFDFMGNKGIAIGGGYQLYTFDKGQTWSGYQTNLGSTHPVIFATPDTLFYKNMSQVRRSINGGTSIDIMQNAYASMTILYPNPIVDTFHVECKIGIKFLRTIIFNSLGVEVARFQSNSKILSGNIDFLAPGVYYARIQTDKHAFTKTILKQ